MALYPLLVSTLLAFQNKKRNPRLTLSLHYQAARIYLTMVAHLHFPPNAPLLPTPSGPRSLRSVRLSYASVLASPRISPSDSGPITFASRASLSHGSLSRLDYFDEEF